MNAIEQQIIETCAKFGITNKLELAHLLGQCNVESGAFTQTNENFNYSAAGLIAQWGTHFTATTAHKFGRTVDHSANQEMIANIAYANRMGNGDIDSGDGYKYRGAGFIQVTGKTDQIDCMNWLNNHAGQNLTLETVSIFLRNIEGAILSVIWFWMKNCCGKWAQQDNCGMVTEIVNGCKKGTPAYIKQVALRQQATDNYKRILGC